MNNNLLRMIAYEKKNGGLHSALAKMELEKNQTLSKFSN